MAIQTGDDQNGIFATINITPLTDVFLVLLIIFMVATAITVESAAHVDLPRVEAPSYHQQSRGVTITYTSDHQLFVNGRHVAESDLKPTVQDALARSPEKLVIFNGDPSVILGDMVRIVDIAKSSGAEQFALAVSGNSAAAESAGVPAVGPAPGVVVPGPEPAPEAVTPAQ